MKEEEARENFLNKLRSVLQKRTREDISFDSQHDLAFFREIKEYALEDNPNVLTSQVADKFLVPLGLGMRVPN